jgi:hypothetical protein
MFRYDLRCLSLLLMAAFLMVRPLHSAQDLKEVFLNPPVAAKPWNYWFWINGNITKEGITGDLEAMARAGIEGVLIMEVAQPQTMAPAGPVAFGSDEWREMFKFVVTEAKRLGLKVSMNNDAGWSGSGGPWVEPRDSMKHLVAAEITVTGPGRIDQVFPQPKAEHDFYQDVRLLAYPKPATGAKKVVPKEAILDLSRKMDVTGRLAWQAPAGEWRILRIGMTTTGVMNRPAPASGHGLECDKFDPEALRRHFDAFVGKLVADNQGEVGKVFTMTHIDSWEVGTQNWTWRMAEAFKKRRGYELWPWLVVLAGGQDVGSAELTERFRWDFKRTQSELCLETYVRTARKRAHSHGLELSMEAYSGHLGFLNPLTYAAEVDLPMGEFWITRWGAWHLQCPRLMASVAHVHGKIIVGAEALTSWPEADWFTEHPYSVKTTADWALCEGINRFVFHRNVLHPWNDLVPGMSFGGFGWHADRHQTWWEPGVAFTKYLARSQALLQAGQFVADICRLVPAGEHHGHRPGMGQLPGQYDPIPVGYNFDYLSDRACLEELSVKAGRLVTRSGMSYHVMQLPNSRAMTPELLARLRDLVKAGAVIIGPRPERSPSLQNYPKCDERVEKLAAEVWGYCDGKKVTSQTFGKGRVFWGVSISEALLSLGEGPDLEFVLDPPMTEEAIMSVTHGRGQKRKDEPLLLMPTSGLNWIHRQTKEGHLYFLANPQHRRVNALCEFRVTGLQPEVWDPLSGQTWKPAVYLHTPRGTRLQLGFERAGSLFVVFREKSDPGAQITEVRHNGSVVFDAEKRAPAEALPEIRTTNEGALLTGGKYGTYTFGFANGRQVTMECAGKNIVRAITDPWDLSFQPGRGAPERVHLSSLVDWSNHPEFGIRHFSGTATYRTSFDFQPVAGLHWQLDLGDVRVMAEVKLNGRDLGILWKPTFAVDVTEALKPGRNELEIKVTNLWPNRLIGDEHFPDDCTPDGSWKKGPLRAWPEWVLNRSPRPEPRRVTFHTWKYYSKDMPLIPSGLLGPVMLRGEGQDLLLKRWKHRRGAAASSLAWGIAGVLNCCPLE